MLQSNLTLAMSVGCPPLGDLCSVLGPHLVDVIFEFVGYQIIEDLAKIPGDVLQIQSLVPAMRQYHNFMFLAMTHEHTRSVAWKHVEMPWEAIMPQRRVERTRMVATLDRSNFQFVHPRLQRKICNHACLFHIHLQMKLPTKTAVNSLMHLLQYFNHIAFQDNSLGDYRPGSTALELQLFKLDAKIERSIAYFEQTRQRQHWKSVACIIA